MLIRKRFAVRFFFLFGRPKKNVKSVVISVLVTRRCSFGLQMKEVQSFTRCVFFFLQGLKKKERWGEGDKMMTFFIVSQLWRSNIHQQLVIFSYSRLGKGPGLPYFLEMTCMCQDCSFFFFHVIIHASIPINILNKKSLEVLPCPLPPLGQIPHPFKPRSQPFFRLAIRLHMPRSKHFKHALRQFAFPNEFTLVIR